MIADLTGKNALITGASSGLGKGIAQILAQQGASIIVADIDSNAQISASPDPLIVILADLDLCVSKLTHVLNNLFNTARLRC